MKTIIVSNGNLALALKNSLENYVTNPAVHTFCFTHRNHTAAVRAIAQLLIDSIAKNPNETYLILADTYNSIAYIETKILLARLNLIKHATIYTGVNLPMLLQLYDKE